MSVIDEPLDAVELAEFSRVLDVMDLCSDRVEALRLLGFCARWEWCSADEYPLIRVGRQTW